MTAYDKQGRPVRDDVIAFPAVAARRDDGFEPGSWRVTRGSARRGDAFCNVNDRVLHVPSSDSPTGRLVQAHELMHARVSPTIEAFSAALAEGLSERALMCAEEARVNHLVGTVGFDLELLTDGTEKEAGTTVGQSGDWPEALCFAVATINTGGHKAYLRELRKHRPEWSKPLAALLKEVNSIMATTPSSITASTRPSQGGLTTEGFHAVTMRIARLLTTYITAALPTTPEELSRYKRGMRPGGRRPPSGTYAPLVWRDQPEFERVDLKGDIRKAKPSVTGLSMRYPNRYLTDPQMRVMGTRSRAEGGLVIIDQSGSMDIDEAVLEAAVKAHPKARIIGYSHRPGDGGSTPNAWVLAARSKVASPLPQGNVGNGVDGPILEWAIKHRRGGEPLIWICDGQVTDSHDHPGEHLSQEVAELVIRHKIRVIKGLAELPQALRSPRNMRPSEWEGLGRLGRAILARRH